MNGHDPLCGYTGNVHDVCDCELIAKVRREERTRAANIVENTRNVWRDPDMAWQIIEAMRAT